MLFGGSRSGSKSDNRAYGDVSSALKPTLGYARDGLGGLSRLLSGESSGWDAFKRMTGFDARAQRGSRGITGNAAAGGLLRSGSTAMGLERYSNDLENENINQYIQSLLGLGNAGQQSAEILSGAGRYSSDKSSSSNGGLGRALGKVLSDPRLKKDVIKLGELEDGLGVYEWSYLWENTRNTGVMANEVARLRPWALGPEVNGFMTVNYEELMYGPA